MRLRTGTSNSGLFGILHNAISLCLGITGSERYKPAQMYAYHPRVCLSYRSRHR